MQICLFEDDRFSNFHPLTLTRPVDDLRVGIRTIGAKWEHALGSERSARMLRDNLKGVFSGGTISETEPCRWINSRYLPSPSLAQEILELEAGSCLRVEDEVIAACATGEASAAWLENGNPDFDGMFVIETSGDESIRNLWDLYALNGKMIRADLEAMEPADGKGAGVSPNAFLEEAEKIHVADDAVVEAGCVLDASGGPIYIGPGARVMAGSVLRGPVAVCRESVVKAGAKIYGDTTIGPVCKVGGEINNCIFHSYSNKAHDGFAGNSLFGQWVNIGADTNTSNLKNNYSTVRITDWKSREEVETGQQFLGAIVADHTKTAINTQLNTGTVCGVSCNIFSADFPPKFLPSFSWVGSNVIQPYRLDRAFEAMETMMARRDVELSDAYREMMRTIHREEH